MLFLDSPGLVSLNKEQQPQIRREASVAIENKEVFN